MRTLSSTVEKNQVLDKAQSLWYNGYKSTPKGGHIMNTLPLSHHIGLADTLVPSLRWDGVTPIDTHRKACDQKLRELIRQR